MTNLSHHCWLSPGAIMPSVSRTMHLDDCMLRRSCNGSPVHQRRRVVYHLSLDVVSQVESEPGTGRGSQPLIYSMA